MTTHLGRLYLILLVMCFPVRNAAAGDWLNAGFLFDEFSLTLSPGDRTEAFGPFYYAQEREEDRTRAIPPLFSHHQSGVTDFDEVDFLYPILTYDRYGSEYRWQLLQLLSFSGGEHSNDSETDRFTLFPIVFYQNSTDSVDDYLAVLPIYGRLKNRLFREQIDFVAWPLYVKTQRRGPGAPLLDGLTRSSEPNEPPPGRIITYNYVYPIFHLRYGDQLRGWQVWPLTGYERKAPTTATNMWGDAEVTGGHRRFFALWPIFFNESRNIGTDNPESHHALLPLYSALRSPRRDSTTCPWPIGFTYTEDRVKQYREWGAPWPLFVVARGEGKNTTRAWPLFSHAKSPTLESGFYLWPVYKFNRIDSEPLDRRRTRILFFLYSDKREKNTETGAELRRTDFWPLYTWHRDFEGNERLQVLSALEPLLPTSKSIERNYSQLWTLWRSERSEKTGATSQSLLWNLYRRDTAEDSRKCSLIFGLFQYQSDPGGRRWRVFYIPFGKLKKDATAADAP